MPEPAPHRTALDVLGGGARHDKAAAGRLNYIDACRAIALLCVIAVHCGQVFPSIVPGLANATHLGMFGVQLFFVASAYTIARSSTLGNYANFMGRRAFRILPMYVTGVVLYAGVAWAAAVMGKNPPFLPDGFDAYTPTNVGANLLLIHGLYPPANNNVVPGGWSIGTEWLFYVIAPVVVGLARRPVVLLAGAMTITAAFAASVAGLLGPQSFHIGSFWYYGLLNNLTPFALGIVLSNPTSVWWRTPSWRLAGLLGIALVILAALVQLKHFPAAPLLPLVAGYAGICIVVLSSRLPATTRLIRLGSASFSGYVLHFVVIIAIAHVSEALLGFRPDILMGLPLAVLITYALSNFTYKRLEMPFMQLGKRAFRRTGRRHNEAIKPTC